MAPEPDDEPTWKYYAFWLIVGASALFVMIYFSEYSPPG